MKTKTFFLGSAVLFLAMAAVAIVAYRACSPPPERQLDRDTTWQPGEQPLVISNRVVVPRGVTLTIQPGTTVLFQPRAGLRIQGRLVAEGKPEARIRLARPRVPFRLWAGIRFEDSVAENRLSYIDIEAAGSEGQALFLTHATVTIDHARFFGAQCTVIRAVDSSLTLRRSVIDPVGSHEVISALRAPVGGTWLIEGNTFYPNFGYNDIIDVTECRPPGPVARIVDNLFLGGGDDGIDADKSEAHIEGNIFVNFHLKGHKKHADGVQAGGGARLVVTNNLFVANDGAVMVAGGSHVLLANNTFVRNRDAVVWLSERSLAGGGATVRDCIFWGNGPSFAFAERATALVVSNSVLPEAARWPGPGNVDVDPRFRDAASGDFRLAPESPAAGRGAEIDPARVARAMLGAD